MNKNKERFESIKVASISAIVGTLAGLPISLAQAANTSQYFPELPETSGAFVFIKVMGLREALRLKSFDSKELEIRATRMPKGDPPYLNVVNENLYQIREPEVPNDQGGLCHTPTNGGNIGMRRSVKIARDIITLFVTIFNKPISFHNSFVNVTKKSNNVKFKGIRIQHNQN
ncbi:hypothetical protein HanIR_Chr04g0155321 [Helianthus annuus]|nr:hypothetical protein HanIR_Chr04g0155321 [Helianthus annuus]